MLNNKKMKRLVAALVVGLLGVGLVVLTKAMARGGFLSYALGIVIFVCGCVGLGYLKEALLSQGKKRDDTPEE